MSKERTKSVRLSDASMKIVSALAAARELSASEACEHLIKVGDTRIRALSKHTKLRSKARKAAKKAKKLAKVIPIVEST